MIRRRHHPAATQRTARLEAFTDGVFAIAATLLVLDLTSHPLGAVTSDAEMWDALRGMGSLFVNFALSFVLLCLLWMTHVRQFELIARADSTLVWLNSFRLLFVVLVPFATSLTTEYADYFVGRMALPTVFFLALVLGWLQWIWVVRRREVVAPDLADADAGALARGALSAVIIAAAIVALSPLIGSAAFLLFLVDPLLTRALRGTGS